MQEFPSGYVSHFGFSGILWLFYWSPGILQMWLILLGHVCGQRRIVFVCGQRRIVFGFIRQDPEAGKLVGEVYI